MSKDDDPPGEAEVKDQLRQAPQALGDAEDARNAELSDTVVINRLYYTFPCCTSCLYDHWCEPRLHGGVLSLCGSEIVSTGDVQPDHGRFLNQLSGLRKQADYGYG